MKKFACQYALLRFRPFVETGEFANVGVVMMAPEARFFGFRLLKRYGRITQFFHQLDRKVYLEGRELFKEELDRFTGELRRLALDGRKTQPDIPLARNLFNCSIITSNEISSPKRIRSAYWKAQFANCFSVARSALSTVRKKSARRISP